MTVDVTQRVVSLLGGRSGPFGTSTAVGLYRSLRRTGPSWTPRCSLPVVDSVGLAGPPSSSSDVLCSSLLQLLPGTRKFVGGTKKRGLVPVCTLPQSPLSTLYFLVIELSSVGKITKHRRVMVRIRLLKEVV